MTKPLAICDSLIDKLAEKKIRYCHWKSNAHLAKSFAGYTDFDLLVHSDDHVRFNEIIFGLNFKKIISPPEKQFPGIEDFLGFDPDTGKLCHLHVHYQLIIGQKFIKNYHLSIERFVLSNLRQINGVCIPKAEVELFLLIIRAILKFDLKDTLVSIIKQNGRFFPIAIYKEFEFLKRDYNKETFHRVILESQLPLSPIVLEKFFEKLSAKKVTLNDIFTTRIYLLKSLRQFQRHTYIHSCLQYMYCFLCNQPFLNKINFLKPQKKTFAINGYFFALVGVDGSGKSTLANELTSWLSWKLQVSSVYFGIPKFKYRAYFLLYNSLTKIVKFPLFKPLASIEIKAGYMRWMWIAKHRLRLYHDSLKKIKKGEIIIADRYPLEFFWSMSEPMDGPRIRNEFFNLEEPAHREERLYSQIGYPDKIFVLKTNPDELKKRKIHNSSNRLNEKIKAIASLSDNSYMSIVDGNQEYNEVLLDIKTRIWEML